MSPADTSERVPPSSTYRVQLHSGWTFDDAAAIVPRLAALGISHLYCSPILQAAAGSTHGYDVVDHHRVSDDLGGMDGLQRLVAELRRHDMGLMIDIVPNHMARDGRDNRWWWDVLANGPASAYARHFDIQWKSADPRADWTVLVPILGDHYGRELESGALMVARDGGGFVVRYHDQELPLAPGSIDPHLDESALASLNADPDALDEVLSRQHYRLAHWRTANEELDYRRFFNIDTLIGLRTEDDEVFADVHSTVFDLMERGLVDDLRLDHVDGLRDPEGYLHRLRQVVGDETRIVVEKILSEDEQLPDTWPVAGTTGYEFAAWVDGVLVDRAGEQPLTSLYRELTSDGEPSPMDAPWPELREAAKHQIMSVELASEVSALSGRLAEICSRYRHHRDHTRRDLHHAVREVLAGFEVYRTYVQPGRPVTEVDERIVALAVDHAATCRPDLDAELLEFIGELLLLRHPGGAEKEFAARFPQVAAPVMAKGVEDTAFYRYHRLISLCEVGGDPGRFGRLPHDFHRTMAHAAQRWPDTMTTLSTHDTKRSADVRARLHVLSEVPGPWGDVVRGWFERHAPLRDGRVDAHTAYLLYQTILGAWPLEADRLVAFAQKATKEAKVHTTWTEPDAEYDAAVESFCRAVLSDDGFRTELEQFLREHRIVERGRVRSLAQLTLLCVCPGIPDLYQGAERWDLSLVDPDNRREVDHDAIASAMAELDRAEQDGDAAVPAVGGELDDPGTVKLWLLRRLLRHRRRHPELYRTSTHEPLDLDGPAADRVLAFSRGDVLAFVPRLHVEQADLAATKVELPAGSWTDLLGGGHHDGGSVALPSVLGSFPTAVLARDAER